MHGFRDNEVLMQAGYDVIVLSPPGGASRYFTWWILKGQPRLYIHVWLTLLPILNGLNVIRLFNVVWDFPTGGEILGVHGQNDPQNVKLEKNICWEGTSLRRTASFEPLCVKKGSKAGRQESRKEESHKKYIFHVCVEQLLAGGFQPNLAHVFLS